MHSTWKAMALSHIIFNISTVLTYRGPVHILPSLLTSEKQSVQQVYQMNTVCASS